MYMFMFLKISVYLIFLMDAFRLYALLSFFIHIQVDIWKHLFYLTGINDFVSKFINNIFIHIYDK